MWHDIGRELPAIGQLVYVRGGIYAEPHDEDNMRQESVGLVRFTDPATYLDAFGGVHFEYVFEPFQYLYYPEEWAPVSEDVIHIVEKLLARKYVDPDGGIFGYLHASVCGEPSFAENGEAGLIALLKAATC